MVVPHDETLVRRVRGWAGRREIANNDQHDPWVDSSLLFVSCIRSK